MLETADRRRTATMVALGMLTFTHLPVSGIMLLMLLLAMTSYAPPGSRLASAAGWVMVGAASYPVVAVVGSIAAWIMFGRRRHRLALALALSPLPCYLAFQYGFSIITSR